MEIITLFFYIIIAVISYLITKNTDLIIIASFFPITYSIVPQKDERWTLLNILFVILLICTFFPEMFVILKYIFLVIVAIIIGYFIAYFRP